MQPTSPTTTPPGTRPPWRDVYRLAALCAALDADELDADTPTHRIEAWIGALLPTLTADRIDQLWAAARLDAAALGQLQSGDSHRWPLCDMDPPRPLSPRYAAFENDLADAVRHELRRAAS